MIGMYISNVKKNKHIAMGIFQLIIGVFFSVIVLGGIIHITEDIHSLKDVWVYFSIFVLIQILSIFFAINNLKVASYCMRFNVIFNVNSSRVVTIEEIARKLSFDEETTLKYLQILIKKRCLINVSLSYAGPKAVVVLEDNTDGTAGRKKLTEYMVVVCPNCGSTNSVKKGSMSNCRFCGQYIKCK